MQLYAMGLISAVALGWFGWQEARSALAGGLAAFLPNVYLAFAAGARRDQRNAAQILRSLYVGEAIKLALTAALLYLALQLPGVKFFALFAGFGAVLVVFWLALLMRET